MDIKERKLEGILCEMRDEVNKLCKFHDYDFRKYKGEQPINKIARNLVDYEAGRTIFETALGVIRKSDLKQIEMNF